MTFIEKNLIENEKITYRTQLHYVNTLEVLKLFPWIFGLIIIKFFLPKDYAEDATVIQVINLFLTCFIVASFFYVIYLVLKIKKSEFVITDKRVVVKFGVFGRDTTETILSKIETVNMNESLFGRILNYGTIFIKGTGGTKQKLLRIKNPIEFKKQLSSQIENLKG